MTSPINDLRYALRQLKKTSGLTLICVVTLALGIGANTAVFSVMNAVLLKSLPVADPDRVVYLNTSGAPKRTGTVDSRETFPYTVYDALRNQHGPLSQVIAYVPLSTGKVAVRYGSQPEEAEGDMVSGLFFSGLGVKFARGHGFTAQDESDHAPIAVISFNYWNRRFAESPDVLGKTLNVNGVPTTIVGVSAEGFEGLEAGGSTDFWIPLQSRAELNAWGNPPEDGQDLHCKTNMVVPAPDWAPRAGCQQVSSRCKNAAVISDSCLHWTRVAATRRETANDYATRGKKFSRLRRTIRPPSTNHDDDGRFRSANRTEQCCHVVNGTQRDASA
jgi:hypothetical protein